MKTQLICRNIKRKALQASMLSAGLPGLCESAHVEEAAFRAEYRAQGAPPFRIWGDLHVSGVHLKATGQGLTLDAAVLLAVRMLERRVHERQHHRELNQHNRLQTPRATRDRFLRVGVGAPNSRCSPSHRRTERLKFVYG